MLTILAGSFLVAARNNSTGTPGFSYPKVAEKQIKTPLKAENPTRPIAPVRRRFLGRF
ncbi:hypothetical protein TG4357_03423 [Thalassovita gelatinovora]|uniref:Uncharacterized protein n=1 Tax=Thalassovita gelatinovora TaxID=53501 RepID=A0A0P1FJI8_THAGE|nr:hypothetical protein TG4357_03423 [Thalassovita gelatinovora]SEQ30324.1 hypothetical protein SAMN04488043_104295 [Thalassovita gelatinovora]